MFPVASLNVSILDFKRTFFKRKIYFVRTHLPHFYAHIMINVYGLTGIILTEVV